MCNKNEKDLYIASCSDTGGIYHYKIADGDFRLVDITRMNRPMYMVIENGKMYIILRTPFGNREGGMVVYDMDENGNLINPSEILSTKGNEVCHILVHNERVYCANYGSGSVIMLPDTLIEHSGHGPNPNRQEGPHVHYVGLTPDKKYITVTDLGLDTIFLYHPDMTLYDTVKVPEGHGVRHLIFSEDGKYLFAINELESTVAAFSYDNGKLKLLDVVSALPAGFVGKSSAAAIRIRDGKIYVSNRGHDSIGILTFENEKLQLIRNVSCHGKHPRDFILEDKYLLSTNMDSNEVAILDMDQDFALVGKLEMEAPLCALVRE